MTGEKFYIWKWKSRWLVEIPVEAQSYHELEVTKGIKRYCKTVSSFKMAARFVRVRLILGEA